MQINWSSLLATGRPSLWLGGLILLLLLVACEQEQDGVADETTSVSARSAYKGALPPGAITRLGKGTINVLELSPDDRYIAAGGDVGLYLYDTENFEEVWSIPSSSPIISLAFSPEGEILATGSEDSSASLVDTAGGAILTGTPANQAEDNGIFALAWTRSSDESDDLLLAVGFNDGNTFISRIDGNALEEPGEDTPIEIIGSLERQSDGVTAMAYNPNGNILATGNRSGRINLWDAGTLDPLVTLEGHQQSNAVQSLAWSPDNGQLISGGQDGSFIVWDMLTMEAVHQVDHANDVAGVAYAIDGDSFSVAYEDGQVDFWHADDPGGDPASSKSSTKTSAVDWSTDLGRYVMASSEGLLTAWATADSGDSAQAVVTLAGHSMHGDSAAAGSWSPDGDLFAAGLGRHVLIWDVEKSEPVTRLEGHESLVTDLVWSPDGEQLATASRDKKIILWDLETGKPIHQFNEHSGTITDLAWYLDVNWLASAGSLDDTINIWDVANGERIHSLNGNGDGLWSVAWSSDSRELVGGNTAGEIFFWDFSGELPDEPDKTIRRHLTWIAGLDFSPDDRYLVSAGAEGKIVITDLADDKAKSFIGHLGPVRRATFSPDGSQIASVGHDGLVVLWDATTGAAGEPVAVFEGHTSGTNSVAWSPDGSTVASGSDDGTVIIWPVTP